MPILQVPAFEAASVSQDVIQCINELLDIICGAETSSDTFPDDFYFVDNAFRDRAEYGGNKYTNLPSESSSDSDSDEEFNRILIAARRMRPKEVCNDFEDDGDDERFHSNCKTEERFIEKEYDKLPAVEQLSFHVNDNVNIQKLGKVVQIVDCLVVIQCDSNVALDFDSVLFDENRVAVGQVFDIFGAITNPFYSIRFNTPEDAKKHHVGKDIYYAPSINEYTRTVFIEQLKNLKITDSCWDGEGECPEDQLAFSDDEEEKRYMAKKRRSKCDRNSRREASSNSNKKAVEHNYDANNRNRRVNYFPKRGRFRPQDTFIPAVGLTPSLNTAVNSPLPSSSNPFSLRFNHPWSARLRGSPAYIYGPNFSASGMSYPPNHRPTLRDACTHRKRSADNLNDAPKAEVPTVQPSFVSKADFDDMEDSSMIVDTRLVENEFR